jgi:hypothetical protein
MAPQKRNLRALPRAFAAAIFNQLDQGNWTDEEAAYDHQWMYRVEDVSGRVRISRARFLRGEWDYYVELPLRYLEHCRLVNYAFAWSRDFLILGGWKRLDELATPELSVQAKRFMRQLSRLVESYPKEARVQEGRDFDSTRLPTLDSFLLTLYHGELHTKAAVRRLVHDHGLQDVLELGLCFLTPSS